MAPDNLRVPLPVEKETITTELVEIPIILVQRSTSTQPHDIEALFAEIRLNIIDEISFAEYHHVLGKISQNPQNVTPCHDHEYGNIIDQVGSGDFCQLETIGREL
jgi:hypothetical protein